jgi:hypothetical protein
MFAVIKYNNSIRNFSLEILNIMNTIEDADKITLKYAEEMYGYNINNAIKSLYCIKNIIAEYSIDDGINRYVFAIIKIVQ